ncbi:MAG: hypothetical protein K2P90_02730, partial [Holosporales bacterium]|nr:hypothetical protein [Holosporales bacterium]
MSRKFLIMIGLLVYGTEAFATIDDWSHENFVLARPYAFRQIKAIHSMLEEEVIYTIKISEGSADWVKCTNFVLSSISQKLSIKSIKNFIADQASGAEARERYFNDLMEVREIPDSDPRKALRGQRGVFAKEDIPAEKLLGIYSGVYTLESGEGYTLDQIAEWEWQDQKGGKGFKESSRYRVGGWNIDDQLKIILEVYGHLAPMSLVNSISWKDPEDSWNIFSRFFMKKGELPVAVYFSKKEIEKGQELLDDYTGLLRSHYKGEITENMALHTLKTTLDFTDDAATKKWLEEVFKGDCDEKSLKESL